MSDIKKIEDHPGYDLIMRQFPRVYLAVCGHSQLESSISPFRAALSALAFLYEELQILENLYSASYPVDKLPINADSDYDYACDLLISSFNRLDLTEAKANARYIGGLLDAYKTNLERLPGSSITYAKSSPRY